MKKHLFGFTFILFLMKLSDGNGFRANIQFVAFPKSITFMDSEADEPTKRSEAKGQVTRELQNFGITMLKKGHVEV